jgi:hypothetical protein
MSSFKEYIKKEKRDNTISFIKNIWKNTIPNFNCDESKYKFYFFLSLICSIVMLYFTMKTYNTNETRCGEIVRLLVEKNIDDNNKVISYTYKISYRLEDKTIETSIVNKSDFDLYSDDSITEYCIKSGNIHEELVVIMIIITALFGLSTITYFFIWISEL